MDKLKVCFIGIGSIAKRHIKNLKQVGIKRGVDFTIDACRRNAVPYDAVNKVYGSIEDLPADYDAIFISNPTKLHLDTLKKTHNKGKNFFIEKPVVSMDQIAEAKQFKLRQNSVYYVACPLRYSAVIQYIKNNVDLDSVISVRGISSSYLPDWRPGQDYRETYSAWRDLGGGVDIDLIHEWDYMTYLFGWPGQVYSLIGKKSDLEIDSNDYAIYIAEYRNKVAELHLDYFGRKTIREIELITKEDTLLGDIAHSKLTYLLRGDTIDFKEKRDDYQIRELNHFIDMITGKTGTEDGYHHGLQVLELTQGRL